ncbi:MAG: hypothetical protein IJ819_00370 [Clostridiales bacterium]|nr:hypothetical protein [Clostridiales bacterium]
MEYPNLLHLGFREIDLSDHFFDSLKEDYEDFENWYERKHIMKMLMFNMIMIIICMVFFI